MDASQSLRRLVGDKRTFGKGSCICRGGRSCRDGRSALYFLCQTANALLLLQIRSSQASSDQPYFIGLFLFEKVSTTKNVFMCLGSRTVTRIVRSIVIISREDCLSGLHLSTAVETRPKILQTFIVCCRSGALLLVDVQFRVSWGSLQVVYLIQVFYCENEELVNCLVYSVKECMLTYAVV